MKFKCPDNGLNESFINEIIPGDADEGSILNPETMNAIQKAVYEACKNAQAWIYYASGKLKKALGKDVDNPNPGPINLELLAKKHKPVNPLIIGAGGSAKTSVIRNFFEHYQFDVPKIFEDYFGITQSTVDSIEDVNAAEKEIDDMKGAVKDEIDQNNEEVKKQERILKASKENPDAVSKHSLNLYSQDAESMDVGDVKGYVFPDKENGISRLLPSTLLDPLKRNHFSVLYLDELNRADQSVRYNVMKVIAEHTIPVALKDGGTKNVFLPYLLFTVASVNPDFDVTEVNGMSKPEYSRFQPKYVEADKKSTLDYFIDYLGDYIDTFKDMGKLDYAKEFSGRLAIIETLLSSPDFQFSDAGLAEEMESDGKAAQSYYSKTENKVMGNVMPRSVEQALMSCDGTVTDFLTHIRPVCHTDEYSKISSILIGTDIKSKANNILKEYTPNSDFFKK